MKRVITLYEISHIAAARSYAQREHVALEECTIVPLEFEVEQALKAQGIPYEPYESYVPLDEEFNDILSSAPDAARRFREHQSMRFYAHKNISLGQVFEPMVSEYLQILGRYMRIFRQIAEISGADALIVPHTGRTLSNGWGALVPFGFLAAADAAQAVGAHMGVPVTLIGEPPRFLNEKPTIARHIGSLALFAYNALIALVVRPRPLKMFASEYWSHVESFIRMMDDVELVIMERSEIKNIPWRELLRHRIRFIHPSDVLGGKERGAVRAAAQDLIRTWHEAKGEVGDAFSALVPGINSWAPIERALSYLIETHTERALVDIEGLHDILRRDRPDKVLLRASIGGTAHHFFIATQVAHALGIPSIELQHAGAVVDPRSAHARIEASYLAAYGPLTREMAAKNFGYAPERIRAIGSPRFDHYVHKREALAESREETLRGLGLDPARPVVFAGVPFAGAFPLVHSSYQVADFFRTFREVQKEMPELQYIFKFRPGNFSEAYQQHARDQFAEGGIAMTNTGNFLPLIAASDAACSGKSTLTYEIMLVGRPLVLFPWMRWDTYTLQMYKGAAPVAWNAKDLREAFKVLLTKGGAREAQERQNRYMAQEYSFDGHAPERMMALLREKLLPLP